MNKLREKHIALINSAPLCPRNAPGKPSVGCRRVVFHDTEEGFACIGQCFRSLRFCCRTDSVDTQEDFARPQIDYYIVRGRKAMVALSGGGPIACGEWREADEIQAALQANEETPDAK